MEKRGCLVCAGVVCTIIAIVAIIFFYSGYYHETTYTNITVTKTEVKNYDNDSKYLIFGEDEDGNSKVFEIEDELFKMRFDSSDLYGKIKEGKTYYFTVIGWRVQFFSWYENILEAKEVK